MNTAHEGMDDMIDYLDANPWVKRRESHRALPLDVVEAKNVQARVAWPNTCNVCNVGTYGNCDCQPQPAEACTEVGAENQNESADAEVVIWLLKGLGVLLGVMFCVWVIVRYGHAF